MGRVEKSILIHGDNGTDTIPLQLDPIDDYLIGIESEHHKIHESEHFFIEDGITNLPLSNVCDIQFKTGNTNKRIHFGVGLSCEAETEWYLYEGVTINTVGSPIIPFNNDRNSTKASVASVYRRLNTSVANATADTAVASAIQLKHGILGALRTTGTLSRNREIILKDNTDYCLRAIANTAGYIDYIMEWYEQE